MTMRARLQGIRLDAEAIRDPATRRSFEAIVDLLLDLETRAAAEEEAASPDVVPCYQCRRRAVRAVGRPALCPDCLPKAAPHGGPQAPELAAFDGLYPPEGWPWCR